MAVENSLVKSDNYSGTQKDFDDDITTLCILCQDIINGVVIDKGSNGVCIMDIVCAYQRIEVFDRSLFDRLGAELGRVTLKSETEVNIPSVEYEVIIHNEKDQQKITYSVCC